MKKTSAIISTFIALLATTGLPSQPNPRGRQNAFLLVFNVTDNSLAYGSYLGGSRDEGNPRLAFDEGDDVYVVGMTYSDDFPIFDKTPATRRGSDVFISKFSVRNDAARRQP